MLAVLHYGPRKLVSDDLGQVVLGRFRMTCVDVQPTLDLLVSRHADRARRRMRGRNLLVTGIIVAVAGITIASIKAVGPVGDPIIGVLMSFARLFALIQLQRRRRVSVELTHGEWLVFTRADAAHIALLKDGPSWALCVGTLTGDRLLQDAEALTVLAKVIPLFRRAATRTIVGSAPTKHP